MAVIANGAKEIAEKLIALLKAANIRIDRAVLFGSYANGTPGQWSDIDLALVSPDFSGVPFYDHKKLIPFILKIDSRIELHPFRPEDFTDDNPFAGEIVESGIIIS